MYRCFCVLFLALSIAELVHSAELSAEQKKLYADLERSLTGAVLVGHFTVSGHDTFEPKPERYELTGVKHVGDDNWMFAARIKYGEHDVTLPITLPIKWAGDTPVITVDKMAFPGLGTYTARVMIYDDHYAGFWSGANHGGHLYGVIEHGPTDEKPSTSPKN